MSNIIGIGIIGTGFARKVQIPSFLHCEGVQIASVASFRIENARTAAHEADAGHYTDDWRQTVDRDDVDLVCITTPPPDHREMTLFAIERGKHILCEKPMAMNVAEAAEMTAAAERSTKLALIDHELRFQHGRQVAYKMLREGVIGKIRHVKSFFQAPHRGDPTLAWNWWSDAAAGGGALGAIGSHIIDSLHWFLGTEISSVCCHLQTDIKERRDAAGEMRAVTSDDSSYLLLKLADGELTEGASGIVSISMTEGPRYMNRVEFFGTGGAMRVDHLGEVFVARSAAADWEAIPTDLGIHLPGMPDTGFARGFMAIAPEIVNAIRMGSMEIEHAATFADGLRVQRVLDAARESDRTGRRISIGE
jgi:predicted dehydrogenase